MYNGFEYAKGKFLKHESVKKSNFGIIDVVY